MIVHIDCNSYFASCEIADHPELAEQPVIVSSSNENNGGIILALNKPAKELGLKRGLPLFQAFKNHKPDEPYILNGTTVHFFEVNHKKYGAISNQIMSLVQKQEIVLDFVQYSVDEFFGYIPVDEPEELRPFVQRVKDLIETETHIPVSCGCASTYTLAKVATHFAKKHSGYNGICIMPEDKREKALRLLPIAEVWGIGRAVQARLAKTPIKTAWDFTQQPEAYILKQFNATVLNTWRELRGVPAIVLTNHNQHQSISHTRTLSKTSHDLNYLLGQLSSYTSAAAFKMREQHSCCCQLRVFLQTNRHRPDLPQYANEQMVKFAEPESDSATLIRAASQAFTAIFRPNYEYKRLGVTLEKIVDANTLQLGLFDDPQKQRQRKAQAAMDAINRKYDRELVHSGNFQEESDFNPGITRL